MKELTLVLRALALWIVRGACACACLLPFSCAFGDDDAVRSLFEDNEDPLFVAVGTDTMGDYAVYSSPTGTVWTGNLVPLPESGSLFCAVYGNGLFLAAGSPSNVYMSTDGLLWARGTTGGGGDVDTIQDGVCGGGRFVVVGSNSAGEVVTYASMDGLSWIKGNLGLSFSGTLNGITYGNGIFVAVGYDSAAGSCLVVSSIDGVLWTGNLKQSATAFPLNDVTFGSGLFVAVGDGGTALSSPNGFAWSWAYYIGKDFYDIRGIAYGSDRFVAVGGMAAGGVYLSYDGVAWSNNIYAGGVSDLQDVAYCHGYFVAVSLGGIALYSPNGLAWDNRTFSSGANLYGITCRP